MLLAHVLAFNHPSAPKAAARLERITGDDPVTVIGRLARGHDGPTTRGTLGVPRDGLRAIAERVAARPYPNPCPPEAGAFVRLLDAAW
ncbi:hypothetical protein [Streptomyces sp. NPDC058092]|uniref:hypothetical protein n=1 Tax=Streptomyces sp. NPDC058092 TaxID=3346336 RepID=UPI0036E4D806